MTHLTAFHVSMDSIQASFTMRRAAVTCVVLLMIAVVSSVAVAKDDADTPHYRFLTLLPSEEPLPPLFPLELQDYFGFGFAIFGLLLAAGGGIGGGGILVPVYILILDFPVKQAIPLASVTVLGGAVANNILNSVKRHPNHPSRPLTDWDLILLLEPMTMFGTLVGADLNDFLPESVIVVLLLLLLTVTAYKTLVKANALYEKESIALQREMESAAKNDEAQDDDVSLLLDSDEEKVNTLPRTVYGATDSDNVPVSKLELSRQETSFEDQHQAWTDATKLTALFAVVTAINLFKGGPEAGGGPVGVQVCDKTCFWMSEVIMLLVIVVFTVNARASLLRRLKSGGPVTSDIQWDETNTVTYPALGIAAGLVAGLFGIGGGIVKGPLMLALDVHPAVASATSASMILFTSSTACISYSVFGLLVYDYADVCILIGFVSTLAGQTAMALLMRRYQRNSYIGYSIGLVVAISAVCMTVESVIEILAQSNSRQL